MAWPYHPMIQSAKPSDAATLREQALRALSRREYSRQELAQKLTTDTVDSSLLQTLLNDLESEGLLSDARYVEALVHVRQPRYGRQKILHELRTKGIAENLLLDADSTLRDTEYERARQVWQKKFTALPKNTTDQARQWRYLWSRGFDADTIKKLLKSGLILTDEA